MIMIRRLRLLLILALAGGLCGAGTLTQECKWEEEPNNTKESASLLPLDGCGRGVVDYSADRSDWWRVNILQAGRLEVVLDSDRDEANLDLVVYDSADRKLGESTGSKGDEKVILEVSAGWHYIRIYAATAGTFSYYTLRNSLYPKLLITNFNHTEKECTSPYHEIVYGYLRGYEAWYPDPANPWKGWARVTCGRDLQAPERRGNVVKIEYDVSTVVGDFKPYSGLWLKWEVQNFKPAEWSYISFYIRGCNKNIPRDCEGKHFGGAKYEGFTTAVKVELKIKEEVRPGERWDWRICYVSNNRKLCDLGTPEPGKLYIIDEWQKVTIPLSDFIPTGWDWGRKINEFVITFEYDKADPLKKGIIYIDDIAFEK